MQRLGHEERRSREVIIREGTRWRKDEGWRWVPEEIWSYFGAPWESGNATAVVVVCRIE
jgi:hypothetical protein